VSHIKAQFGYRRMSVRSDVSYLELVIGFAYNYIPEL